MHPKELPRTFLTAAFVVAAFPLSALAGQNPARAAAKEVVTPSGLRYRDLEVGRGEAAAPGKVVEVQYVGCLANALEVQHIGCRAARTRFDTSREHEPLTFRLGAGDAIKGWDEGLVGMKVGGRRRLVIPPALGFGKQGVGSVVPPNAVLVYEFELLDVREDSGRSR